MKKNLARSGASPADCISHPEHGAATLMSSGRLWCPHQTHDGKPAREGQPAVKGTTPWLDKQTAPDAEAVA